MTPAPSSGDGVVAFAFEPYLGVRYPVLFVDVLPQRLLAHKELLAGGTLHKDAHFTAIL